MLEDEVLVGELLLRRREDGLGPRAVAGAQVAALAVRVLHDAVELGALEVERDCRVDLMLAAVALAERAEVLARLRQEVRAQLERDPPGRPLVDRDLSQRARRSARERTEKDRAKKERKRARRRRPTDRRRGTPNGRAPQPTARRRGAAAATREARRWGAGAGARAVSRSGGGERDRVFRSRARCEKRRRAQTGVASAPMTTAATAAACRWDEPRW